MILLEALLHAPTPQPESAKGPAFDSLAPGSAGAEVNSESESEADDLTGTNDKITQVKMLLCIQFLFFSGTNR